jgi:hypothetical protein
MSDPPPPPWRDGKAVDAALDAVVRRGLAREPLQRYPSAHAMAIAVGATGPTASPVEIARWVAAHAADDLELADERVRLFEQSPPDSVTGGPLVRELTESNTRPRRTRRFVSGTMAAATVLSVAALGVVAAVVFAGRGGRADAGGIAPAAPRVVAVDTAPSAAPSAPVASAPAAPPPSAPVVAPPATSPSAASAPPPAARTRPVRGRGAAKHACDPPYTVDSSGFKHYDPSCF